jgi:hypothetical protein
MITLPYTAIEVFRLHRDFLHEHANPEAVRELVVHAPKLQTDLGVLSINSFLNDRAVENLETLSFNGDGNYRTDKNYKLVASMLMFMSEVSSMYIARHELTELHATVKRMVYDPAHPKHHTVVEPHHDWKDGNAVLYNCNVTGDQIYTVGGKDLEIRNNQLTVLNGESTYLPISHAYGTAVHSVHPPKNYASEQLLELRRDRFLVFFDGEPTTVTMLPPEV